MRWIRGTMAAAALLAPTAGGAQLVSQDFCHGLTRVVNAARNDGGFDSLERSRAAPPHLGFRHGCRAHDGTRTLPAAWWCRQTLAPEELSLARLAARTAACLPDAVRTQGRYHGSEAIFTLPYARILISERGGPRAHVGRIVSFRVEAVGSRGALVREE
ncbi:MAG TPA: hypothetical protein VK403_11880 [Allosphingosinicella sp.]|nr:hypothetical protein [Allosphingosinicella sp.]